MATDNEIKERLPKVLGLRLLGYTEQEIAKELGVSTPTVSDDLNRRIPRVDELQDLARQAAAVKVTDIGTVTLQGLVSVIRMEATDDDLESRIQTILARLADSEGNIKLQSKQD